MSRFAKIARDPLAHFLLFGALFFAVVSLVAPPERGDARIVVTREALLEFIQFRSKAFEPAAAAALLGAMSAEERARLIEDYVEEEALVREAEALGLEEGDYVIRQRMVQKLAFIADAATERGPPGETEIAAYFEANRALYREQPSATFTHVFFSQDHPDADALAAAAVARLNAAQAPFEAAVAEGERFPFHTNYVERTFDYVASQFGDDAAAEIFDSAAPFDTWRGPVRSAYGSHAIFVRAVSPARDPPLAEIRDRVAEDAARDAQDAARRRVIAETIAGYDIRIAPGLANGSSAP